MSGRGEVIVGVIAEHGAADVMRLLAMSRRLRVEPEAVTLKGRHLEIAVGDMEAANAVRRAATVAGFAAWVSAPNRGGDDLLRLSARERQLIEHIAAGLLLKEAAARMSINLTTAREYWDRIKVKWNVRTMAQAAALFCSARTGLDGQRGASAGVEDAPETLDPVLGEWLPLSLRPF